MVDILHISLFTRPISNVRCACVRVCCLCLGVLTLRVTLAIRMRLLAVGEISGGRVSFRIILLQGENCACYSKIFNPMERRLLDNFEQVQPDNPFGGESLGRVEGGGSWRGGGVLGNDNQVFD